MHRPGQHRSLLHVLSNLRRKLHSGSHYETLGVRKGASKKEVRQAFLQKAKLMHPDVAHGPQSQQQFVQLLLAYEVLSDQRRRSDYDAANHTTRSARTDRPSDVRWNRSARSEPGQQGYAAQRAPADTRSLFTALRDSVSDALEHASNGPSFQGGPLDYPYAFELEQRVAGGVHVTDEILHMVVGRTLLGTVKGVGLQQLHSRDDSERPPLLPHHLAGVQGGHPHSPTSSGAGEHRGDRSSRQTSDAGQEESTVYGSYTCLELHYQGRLVASAVVHGRGPGDGQGAERVGAAEPGMDVEEDDAPFVTIYEHRDDSPGSSPVPLAHLLSPLGVGALHFRRIVSCGLVDKAVEQWWEERGRGEQEEKDRLLREVQEQMLQAAALAAEDPQSQPPTEPAASPSAQASAPHLAVHKPHRDRRQSGAAMAGHEQTTTYGQSGAGAAWRDIDPRAPVTLYEEGRAEAWENGQLHHMQRDVHARVMHTAMEEFADGVWRKHTLRLKAWGGGGGVPAVSPASAPAVRGDEVAMSEGEGGHNSALHGDSLAEYLCSPRLHRLTDSEGGVRVDSRARRILQERAERKEKGGSGGLQAASPDAKSALPFPTLSDGGGVWNASHWWSPASFDPLPTIPTLSTHSEGRRTWRHTRKGKAYCAAHGLEEEPSQQDHGRHPTPALSAYATHTLLAWRTPGVYHMRYLRNADGAVEASGSRVNLAAPSTWLWEPRSRAHTGGNFSFDLARRRAVDAALHPAVYILSSAILALEGEVDSMHRHAKMEERVQNVKNALGSLGLRLGIHKTLPGRKAG